MPEKLSGELRRLERALRAVDKSGQQTSKRQRREIEELRTEIGTLRQATDERLLHYHLQLGRLSEVINAGSQAPLGGRVPVALNDGNHESHSRPRSETPEEQRKPAVFDQADWLEAPVCPACRSAERTIVCEWNKLVLLDTAPDEQASRYDYAVCHGCGILYATHRPIGERYRHLIDNFEDVIDKDARNPLLNPYPLTESDREHYRTLIKRGVFVSDHEPGSSLNAVWRDRMENSGHVDLLGSLLNPRGARVLEVRPRAGTILEGLRRHYGADVWAMPIWESQQFIIQELYGIPSTSLIDFDRFRIPFDEPFDLIACNHMFNHAVRLDGFLEQIRNALRPGGHVYLYNEIDDSEFLDGGQSMIATMNPLHLQASDRRSLVRALSAAGFEIVFVSGRHKRNLCLARKTDQPKWAPLPDDERTKRIAAYRRARDRAVLRAPDRIRNRFESVWAATVERAVAHGVARFGEDGELRLVKS